MEEVFQPKGHFEINWPLARTGNTKFNMTSIFFISSPTYNKLSLCSNSNFSKFYLTLSICQNLIFLSKCNIFFIALKNRKNENKDEKSCENTSSFSCNLAWCVKYIAFFYCRQKYTIIFYLSAGYQFQGKKNWTTKNGLQSSPKLTLWSNYFWSISSILLTNQIVSDEKNSNKYSNKSSKTIEPKKQTFGALESVFGFSEQDTGIPRLVRFQLVRFSI